MAGPLDGIRIVDLTTMISGPMATMMLGDQGADVIKVEVPGSGDYTRAGGNQKGGFAASFLNNNRNKRSVTIDLKQPQGREIFLRLAKTADVVIQNFRPGVVERIGIGIEDVRTVAPSIIYVSISGFGENGPYATKPTYDPIIQAVSGLASVQGGGDQNRPRLIRTIVPDKVSALTASQAVTAALFARERTGQGQHVRLSMLDSVLSFLWGSDMGGQTFIGETVSEQRAASFIDLIYETLDGFMSVSVMTNAQWMGLTRALEKPEWLEDERFKTPALRDFNINDRLQMTQDVLKMRPTADWMTRLEAESVPCAPVLTRNELIEHPQVHANESLLTFEHPHAGSLRQARPAARFEKSPSGVRRGAPGLGENTAEILNELGYSELEVSAFLENGVAGG